MNSKKTEYLADRPKQKIWFDGGNSDWEFGLMGWGSRTLTRKVRQIRYRNGKLEGVVLLKGKKICVRRNDDLESSLDWNALFAFTSDEELDRDYGRIDVPTKEIEVDASELPVNYTTGVEDENEELGKEIEAIIDSYKLPFTDVDPYEKPKNEELGKEIETIIGQPELVKLANLIGNYRLEEAQI
jgi:hypothetical protein